jgi:hypothetical protein
MQKERSQDKEMLKSEKQWDKKKIEKIERMIEMMRLRREREKTKII